MWHVACDGALWDGLWATLVSIATLVASPVPPGSKPGLLHLIRMPLPHPSAVRTDGYPLCLPQLQPDPDGTSHSDAPHQSPAEGLAESLSVALTLTVADKPICLTQERVCSPSVSRE